MLFDKINPEPLLLCDRCGGTGQLQWTTCSQCHGYAVGYVRREHWLYWHYPLTRYHLLLARYRRSFNKIRFITVLVIALNFWVWLGFLIYKNGVYEQWLNGYFLVTDITASMKLLLWLGVLAFWYAHYRSIREKQVNASVEHHDYKTAENDEIASASVPASWQEVGKIPLNKRLNIPDTYTAEALEVVGDAYRYADKLKHTYVTNMHLLYALLSCQRIGNIFIRLSILPQDVQQLIESLLQKDTTLTKSNGSDPMISEDFRQALFLAYEKAYEAHQEYVSVTELIVSIVLESPILQELFYDLNIEKRKLLNVVEWVRVRERLQRNYGKLHHAARHRSTKGMDKAMTAVATPFLNQYSEDVTLQAQFGRTEACMARERELEEILRIIEGGQQNVLLVGPYGVGKKTLVNGLAEKMVEEDVPDRIKDKRLVRLSVSSLLAGTTPSGAVERLITIMNEIVRAGNVILYINNIHELMGVATGDSTQSLDVGDTLAEYLGGSKFLTVATTTSEAYAQVIGNTSLAQIFSHIDIKEMDEDQAIQALESKVGYLEYKHQVFFSYDAIEKAVELSKKFIHETYLPGNALEVLTEGASLVKSKKGTHALVTGEDVATVVAEKTRIPVTTVSADESTKLLRLEEALHERVIGQDEAVGLVANALRRARAEVRSTSRPIANFLFLGPTGVGKTELAKTIAEVYFGGEDRMIRLDMSEYQDKSSIYRLLGAPGEKGTGILTEAVRRNPFTLVLLDELEKADKDVLNLFLQVMDDGRLTDSTGLVIDFTNVILIATSNAGTSYVIEQLRGGLSLDLIKDRLLHGELKEYYRPEFLNRFDGIVLFKPLTSADVERIVGLMLKKIAKDLEAKGIELVVEDGALAFFAQAGFDPDFGARPLRRVLQERVENKLAELILSNQLHRRSVVTINASGDFSVT